MTINFPLSVNPMSLSFAINNHRLQYQEQQFPFLVQSFPSPYSVSSIKTLAEYQGLVQNTKYLIIDQALLSLYPVDLPHDCIVFSVEAIESNKSMETVLAIIASFIDNNISKGSRVVAVGGGIIQDLAACSCALFRRGQPFTYLPSTTLGQLDSCVGAKCAVNTPKAKNIIGLFSAPVEVIIPSFMIGTMSLIDHRAGLSEMLRLCLTASSEALDIYTSLLPDIADPLRICPESYTKSLHLSLSIKKSVVEYDEYERDVRRSMNYGHTFGHAIEKLVNFSIPHGIAVLLGMHIANTYSLSLNLMSVQIYKDISDAIQSTISGVAIDASALEAIDPSQIIDQFKYDKKGDGSSVPLILIESPGEMLFRRYAFDSDSAGLSTCISAGITDFLAWSSIR